MREWEQKYLERLADVYIQKYDTYGYEEAKAWYDTFLDAELRKLVHPIIKRKVTEQTRRKK